MNWTLWKRKRLLKQRSWGTLQVKQNSQVNKWWYCLSNFHSDPLSTPTDLNSVSSSHIGTKFQLRSSLKTDSNCRLVLYLRSPLPKYSTSWELFLLKIHPGSVKHFKIAFLCCTRKASAFIPSLSSNLLPTLFSNTLCLSIFLLLKKKIKSKQLLLPWVPDL